MEAYVMIKVEAGKTSKVLAALKKLPKVRQVHACFGLADIIGFVEAADEKDLGEFVFGKIHALPGVVETNTHVVFEA